MQAAGGCKPQAGASRRRVQAAGGCKPQAPGKPRDRPWSGALWAARQLRRPGRVPPRAAGAAPLLRLKQDLLQALGNLPGWRCVEGCARLRGRHGCQQPRRLAAALQRARLLTPALPLAARSLLAALARQPRPGIAPKWLALVRAGPGACGAHPSPRLPVRMDGPAPGGAAAAAPVMPGAAGHPLAPRPQASSDFPGFLQRCAGDCIWAEGGLCELRPWPDADV